MKILIALAVCFALSVFAKDRAPDQVNYPGLPSSPNPSPAPANPQAPIPAPSAGSFTTEDVLSSGTSGQISVQSVVCVVSGTQPYTISSAYGNDVRVARVASGGAISYEIYRGQRFLGACPAIHVLSR